MRIQFQKSLRIAAVLALLGTAGAAQAHTGHGTSTLFEGLAHPFGPDHLLAMLAVGLWSVASLPAGKVWRGPVTFMLSLVAGATLGLLGVTVPMLEQLIALSVVLFGALLIITPFKIATTATSAGLWLVAGAAMLHGLAHGAEAPAGNFADGVPANHCAAARNRCCGRNGHSALSGAPEQLAAGGHRHPDERCWSGAGCIGLMKLFRENT